MSEGYQLRALSGGRPSDSEVSDIVALHHALLPRSPVVALGRYFMESFYYPTLIADGEIYVGTAYVDGECAGFVAATDDPDGFISAATRRHWFRCFGTVFVSLLANPLRLRAVKEAYDIQKHVQHVSRAEKTGEILSLGVHGQFRTRGFVKKRGLRISDDLVDMAVSYLRNRKIETVRAVVDRDNLEAQLFYRARGWTIGSADVQGWGVPSVEFRASVESPESGGSTVVDPT